MPTVIVTGSGGLIGSESVKHFVATGNDVVGIENDSRAAFFGPEASTRPNTQELVDSLGGAFRSEELDIRDADGVMRLVAALSGDLTAIVHTAAQPSHDWAASDPQTDFGINATGTLNLLEAARAHTPDVPFVHCSTNKVYGDLPNHLPLVDIGSRLELPEDHQWYGGIDTTMSIGLHAFPVRRLQGGIRPASCRSTGATSTCRRCASVAAASRAPHTPERSSTGSSPIS